MTLKGLQMETTATLGPLNKANVQRSPGEPTAMAKGVEQNFAKATKAAVDTSIDRGVEVLIASRPVNSVDPTYENLGVRVGRK